jgi:hypothetical protein
MQTREILTIIALSVLGLCLFIGIGKSMTKNPKKKMDCDKACGMLFFVAVVLLAVSQVLDPKEPLTWPDYINGVGQGPLGKFGVYSIQTSRPKKVGDSCITGTRKACGDQGNLKCVSSNKRLGGKGTCVSVNTPILPPHFGKTEKYKPTSSSDCQC